ncbi:hypothetical protein MRX96_014714 [Rhipicephalus microplus]
METADDAPQGPVIIRQTVFVFPREQFDPNYVRLVTRGRDPATAVACLLGFFKLVCEDGYKVVLRASCLDGNWLDEVDVGRVSGAPVRRQLRALSDDSEPADTVDDFIRAPGCAAAQPGVRARPPAGSLLVPDAGR